MKRLCQMQSSRVGVSTKIEAGHLMMTIGPYNPDFLLDHYGPGPLVLVPHGSFTRE